MKWSGNMLLKKLFRTAWKYKAQFLSMILMIAIGVAVFVGFNVEWYSLQEDVTNYFDDTGFADYRLMSDEGFSKEDLEKIQALDGVDAATRYFSINVDYLDGSDEEKKLGLSVVDCYGNGNLSFYKVEGIDYDESVKGGWISDSFAEENNLRLGDVVKLSALNQEVEIEIVGLIKSSEYTICVADDNQIMPDYNTYGYIYISPQYLKEIAGVELYNQINVVSDINKEDMVEKVDAVLGRTTMVTDKDENISYSESHGEMQEGKTMASLMPVLFVAIAVLTMITTMGRLTANEKVQIGTLKALGYRDKKILWHYTSYGFFIGIIGILLGILLGYGIGAFMINPNGIMATYIDLPSWPLKAPWYTWPVLVMVLIVLTFISYLSVKKMLAGTAAQALRPLAPKKIKESRFEKSKLFHKLGFTNRWNFRDVTRHKTRSAMTLLGVMGCTILIIASLGVNDTIKKFTSMMYDDICNYNTKISLSDEATNEDAYSLADKYDGDLLAGYNVKIDGEPISLEVYDIKNNKMRFVDEDNDIIELGNDGVYICMRLSEDYEIGSTIRFSPYGSNDEYEATVAGYIRSMSAKNVCMTKTYAENNKIPCKFNAIYTDAEAKDIDKNVLISGTQTKKTIVKAMDTFTGMMNQMILLLICAALGLGAVVLYNLGVMSYTERYRELATLKVVGFKDKKISGILISQNNWLAIIGIIAGLPIGVLILNILIVLLAGSYEMDTYVSIWSYLITIMLTFGVSMLISFFVAKKNKKIDMVEALKGAE